MRWQGRRQSSNVRDRRSLGPVGLSPRMAVGGGGGVVFLLIIMALVWAMGGNPLSVLTGGGHSVQLPTGAVGAPAEEDLRDFVATVLADTEEVWNRLFAEIGADYREPTLVLFRGETSSACGWASSATGPFYCPADEQIYMDLSFYEQLAGAVGAPGDFAQAYVIAHEVGHHVQNLLGNTEMVHKQRGSLTEAEYNDLSVRLELQADFLAGVWAHHAQRSWQILEPGDIEEALGAAAAIGDDRLQMRSRGYVVPDSFTHGTSAQRVKWFRLGLETGDLSRGDTFATPNP